MKNVVYMSDDEFYGFLEDCIEAGMTETQISKMIEADCAAICPEENFDVELVNVDGELYIA